MTDRRTVVMLTVLHLALLLAGIALGVSARDAWLVRHPVTVTRVQMRYVVRYRQPPFPFLMDICRAEDEIVFKSLWRDRGN